MKLNIAICDDEQSDLDHLTDALQSYYIARDIEIRFDSFLSGKALLQSYKKSGDYQIVLLDVEMPDLDGLKLAEIIRETIDNYVIIVFISSYPKYMQDSFHVRPFYYLTKPFNLTDIYRLMDDIVAELDHSHVIYSLLSTEKGDVTINIKDVLYIETTDSKNNILEFHFSDKMLTCRGTLAHWNEELSGYNFYQCYRSILVNLIHIHYFDKNTLILDNGARIPISRTKGKELRDLYLNHAVELIQHTV